ncbi:hypothetical protein ACFQX6_31545 [Streptosporangium lutulentum]
MRKATMTMPVLVPELASRSPADSYRRALADCAVQQLSGHRFANADPYATERMCEEILEDLYKTGVAYPRFSYMDDSVTNDFNPVWPRRRTGSRRRCRGRQDRHLRPAPAPGREIHADGAPSPRGRRPQPPVG